MKVGRPFTIASACSLLAASLLAVGWGRSDSYYSGCAYTRVVADGSMTRWKVFSSVGRISTLVERTGPSVPRPPGARWDRWDTPVLAQPSTRWRGGYFRRGSDGWVAGLLGFEVGRDRGSPSEGNVRLAVPYPLLVAVLLVLPTLRTWWTIRLRWLPKPGTCPKCGYDVRSTPDRCPECGLELNSNQPGIRWAQGTPDPRMRELLYLQRHGLRCQSSRRVRAVTTITFCYSAMLLLSGGIFLMSRVCSEWVKAAPLRRAAELQRIIATQRATPAELREASAEMMEALRPGAYPANCDDDRSRVFIVDYLGASDQAARDEAVRILAQSPRLIRSSVFTPYLSKKHPLNVRVVALARSLARVSPMDSTLAGTGRTPVDDNLPIERMKPLWRSAFADLAASAQVPPNFQVVAEAVGRYGYAFDAIDQHDRPRILRWCLDSLGRDDWDHGAAVMRFPTAMVAEQLLSWYPQAKDAAARRQAFEIYQYAAVEADYWLKIRPFLELVANDSDPALAKLGASVLAEGKRRNLSR